MKDTANSQLFETLSQDLMAAGLGFRFKARGMSMQPTIRDGEFVRVEPVTAKEIRKRDIILFSEGLTFRAHRVAMIDKTTQTLRTKGDASAEMDFPVHANQITGRVVAKESAETKAMILLTGHASRARFNAWRLRGLISRSIRVVTGETLTSIRKRLQPSSRIGTLLGLFLLLGSLAIPEFARAAVAVDATTSVGQRVNSLGPTITFNHTSTGTNLVLVVGVSLNITNRTGATVGSITYNGVALTLSGAHNDAGNTRRVEMWYLIAPAAGTHAVAVTMAGLNATNIGVVAGATTFTGADQTSPLRPFVSADGENAALSSLNVPSGTGEVVLDTLAIAGNDNVTGVGPSQTQVWGLVSSAFNSAATDVWGNGSTRAGAPSVPMSETFNANSNWSMGAVSVRPLQADMSVSIAATSSLFPNTLTYVVTVTNNGPSTATGESLTDTLPSGVTLVSATAPGATCTGTTTIVCTSASPMTSGTSGTLTIVVTPSAIGGYTDSATVTSSVADYNLGNNSATAVAFSEANTCSTPTTGTPTGNLTGIINTYFPGTGTAAAGATSLTVGAATGAATPVAVGDLLIVMQIQNASINSTNTSSYGDGNTGSGSTNLNNTGVYEYVTATAALPTAGGTLNFSGGGPSGGLLYSYVSSAATATQGKFTFQVIRVPHYASATIGAGLTASAWNGATGGVLALDINGALNVGAANTISVGGLGFRGGAGLQLNGGTGTATDYVLAAPATYAGAVEPGADGAKGEGIAGTPLWVESGGTYLSTTTDGYPVGSMARGAPGNAGAGGTDADPQTASPGGNDENAGGGGGANGGAGGGGGDAWQANLSTGGLGGTAFPASTTRVTMGGGGGAGSRNNSDGDTQASSGSAGGGIVIFRMGSITGTATISANGTAAYAGTANDAGGGGGAGGTIVVLSAGGGEGNLTLNAQGGKGGDAWDAQAFSLGNRHGPGGGGGGGVVLISGTPAGINVAGGANGNTLNPGVPYGATSGTAGFSVTNATQGSTAGPHNLAQCTDVSITKTASPNPVKQNQTLTYTLTVTNNGTMAATNVTVTDPLPTADVTYLSSSISPAAIGSCTQAGGTVTCNIPTLNSLAVATITINVTALSPSIAVNTASVSETQADYDNANNVASQTETITYVTQVSLSALTATSTPRGTLLSWKTDGEFRNVGFNVYREVNGERVRVNPSLIAGSALRMRSELEQHGGKTYAWIDRSAGAADALYWLEDVDLNGAKTMHGPVSVSIEEKSPETSANAEVSTNAVTVSEMNGPTPGDETLTSHVVENVGNNLSTQQQQQVQFQLASKPAVKIFIRHEGWYRITQPELVAAGLNPFVDPSRLQLFAEGTEQAIRLDNARPGYGGFGPQAAIEFYGTGLDTPYSDKRVYWLIAGNQLGRRISRQGSAGNGPQPQSFMETVELKQRTIYFAALLRENTDNFFGAVVTTTAVDQVLNTPDVAPSTQNANLRIVLQGAIDSQPHDVTITLNGEVLGGLNFIGEVEGTANFEVPTSMLHDGANTVTLTAQNGDNDISVVDYITLTYPRTYSTQDDHLKFTAQAGDRVVVNGFRQIPTRLVDITNPNQPIDLVPQVLTENRMYSLEVKVPWLGFGQHTLLAVSDQHILKPYDIVRNQPSNWHSAQPGAELVILSYPAFEPDVNPIAQLHRSEGKTTAVVSINDVYDEFNFGERSPYAVRSFLQTAASAWTNKPKYLLLVGDASLDPRDYLGFGFFDFVPTKMIPTSQLKTASDDWFSDFTDTGFAQIATGRLPVRTDSDARTVVGKIVGYAGTSPGGWTNQALMVADQDPQINFTQESEDAQKGIPSSMNVFDVYAAALDPDTARQDVLTQINSGQLLVNYTGHGSVEVWSGENLLTDTSAAALTNGSNLPVFLIMNCLNGYFEDVYTTSLAETLLLSNTGGAVAVWASSGLNQPDPQAQMDNAIIQSLFTQPAPTLGDAIAFAKSGINDPDVRKTYILFGDPLMHLKSPAPTQSSQ